jgi:outer membrane immunogenic protein
MKTILLSTAAIAMFAAAPAMAQSWPAPEYYGSLGYSHMEVDEVDADLGAITGRFGAKLTPYFGFEGEGSVGVRDDQVTIGGVAVDVEHQYDLAAYGVAFLPVNPNFELFARVGYGTTEVKASAGGVSVTDDGNSWNYGVGANYYFDGQNGIRGDWTRRDFTDDGGEADVWSVSYIRRF